MPQFGYGKNGELIFYSEYTIRGVDTVAEIFPSCKKTSKLVVTKDKQPIRDVYSLPSKTYVARKVFYDFLMLVFDKLTEGGMFVFPGKTEANISLRLMPEDSVKRLSSEGRLWGIDIIKSRYKVPYFKFDFGPSYARKDRFIKVPVKIWHKAFKNAEEGKIKYTYYRKILK